MRDIDSEELATSTPFGMPLQFRTSLAFVAVVVASCSIEAQAQKIWVPEFYRKDCREFRELLREHTDVSRFDRKHATNLGIAAMVLFWTGIPSFPLGIASIWTGRRMNTDAHRAMVDKGVRYENYEEVNKLCAKLLEEEELEMVTFRGKNNAAIILGAIAIALGAVVVFFQGCYGVLLCCMREPKTTYPDNRSEEDTADDEDEDEDEDV